MLCCSRCRRRRFCRCWQRCRQRYSSSPLSSALSSPCLPEAELRNGLPGGESGSPREGLLLEATLFFRRIRPRAPAWMRRFGLEWSYRLLSNPRRLAYRYLVRGPRVLPMLSRYRVSLRTERERSLATNEVVDPDAEPLDAM